MIASRALLVKLPIASQLQKVMKYVGNLAKTGHFVTKQLPAERKERKQFVVPYFKKGKAIVDQKTQLLDDKLLINGQLQRKYLPPKLPVKIDHDPDRTIQIFNSVPISEGGSTFYGFAAKASCEAEIRNVLDEHLKSQENATASHVVYAFSYNDPIQGQVTNFDSDGDFGLGTVLTRILDEKDISDRVLILTRSCGPQFQHIGKRRFEITKQVCEEALYQLELS